MKYIVDCREFENFKLSDNLGVVVVKDTDTGLENEMNLKKALVSDVLGCGVYDGVNGICVNMTKKMANLHKFAYATSTSRMFESHCADMADVFGKFEGCGSDVISVDLGISDVRLCGHLGSVGRVVNISLSLYDVIGRLCLCCKRNLLTYKKIHLHSKSYGYNSIITLQNSPEAMQFFTKMAWGVF